MNLRTSRDLLTWRGREPSRRKRPKNTAEGLLFDLVARRGRVAIKRGWPDFSFVSASGRLVCIEVKPRATFGLSSDQYNVMVGLAKYGVPCFWWTPETGFVRIKGDGLSEPATSEEVFL